MPALRDRADDIPLIAEHFLAKYTREMNKTIDGFSPEALAALRAYPWPGNVRELENIDRARGGARIGAARRGRDAAGESARGPPGHAAAGASATPIAEAGDGFNLERHLQDIERSHLERALERAGGVQTRAADVLGLSFRQFRYLDEEARPQARMTRRRASWRRRSLLAIVAAIYVLRLDDAAGLIVDDAWYIVLAKALADGDGLPADQLGDDADHAVGAARISRAAVAGVLVNPSFSRQPAAAEVDLGAGDGRRRRGAAGSTSRVIVSVARDEAMLLARGRWC